MNLLESAKPTLNCAVSSALNTILSDSIIRSIEEQWEICIDPVFRTAAIGTVVFGLMSYTAYRKDFQSLIESITPSVPLGLVTWGLSIFSESV